MREIISLDLTESIEIPHLKVDEVIVFVHGFNNSREDANATFFEMVHKKREDGKFIINPNEKNMAYICCMWDSTANYKVNGRIGSMMQTVGNQVGTILPQFGEEISREWNIGMLPRRYVEDIDRITESFVWFNKLIISLSKKCKVHLISHSLGGMTIVNYIGQLSHDYLTRKMGEFGHMEDYSSIRNLLQNIKSVILIAPDVNIGIFKEYIRSSCLLLFETSGTKLVIFANNLDIAILASKYIIRVNDKRLGNADDANEVINSTGIQADQQCIEIVNVNIRDSYNPLSRYFPISHNYYTNDNVLIHINKTITRSDEHNVQLVKDSIFTFVT